MHAVLMALMMLQTPKSAPENQKNVSGVEDEIQLAAAGREFHVPSVIMWALAQKESGPKGNNSARGPGFLVVFHNAAGDSIGSKRVCREIGRMQILPCTLDAKGKQHSMDWSWLNGNCTPKNLLVYIHNIRCGAAILAYRHKQKKSWSDVIQSYNGSGPQAQQYQNNAEAIIGRIVLRMIQRQQTDSTVELAFLGVGGR